MGYNTKMKQTLKVVKNGIVSELEIAYQAARRQLREAIEQTKQAVNAVNATKPQLLKAYLSEIYPDLAISVTHRPSCDHNVFSMDCDISTSNINGEPDINAIYDEAIEYLRLLDGGVGWPWEPL